MKLVSYLKKKFWNWPNSFVWKITEKATVKSRRRKYTLFISHMKPKLEETILDVGVSPHFGRVTNYLELWYPHPEQITALTKDEEGKFKNFRERFPKVRLVFGDGRDLDFPDNNFDIVFCNAVVEHVGNEREQRRFIHELVRVSKRAFITTPNYYFPMEVHTLIPFVHYLPRKMSFWIYRKLGRNFWADLNYLNPLTPKKFVSLFPSGKQVRIFKQRILGIPHSLIAVVEKKTSFEEGLG